MLDYSSRATRRRRRKDKVFQSFLFFKKKKIAYTRAKTKTKSTQQPRSIKVIVGSSATESLLLFFVFLFFFTKTNLFASSPSRDCFLLRGIRRYAHYGCAKTVQNLLLDSAVPVAGFQIATFPKCRGVNRRSIAVFNYRGRNKSGRILLISRAHY